MAIHKDSVQVQDRADILTDLNNDPLKWLFVEDYFKSYSKQVMRDENGRLTGYAVIRRRYLILPVITWHTLEPFRSKGMGAQLVRALQRRHFIIFAKTQAGRPASDALARKAGFKQLFRLRGQGFYYWKK